ncbi:hypothetical protein [Actinomadura sp. NPDC049753]|uniref:hypothetical protein n=1 Tax=Actinomadura sp. NPDC049753 TaxID=3154739 RepID=UPI003414FF98
MLDAATEAGFLKQDYCFLNWHSGDRVRYGLSSIEGLVERPYNLHLPQDRLVDVVLGIIARESLPVDVRWGRDVIGLTRHDDAILVLFPDRRLC